LDRCSFTAPIKVEPWKRLFASRDSFAAGPSDEWSEEVSMSIQEDQPVMTAQVLEMLLKLVAPEQPALPLLRDVAMPVVVQDKFEDILVV